MTEMTNIVEQTAQIVYIRSAHLRPRWGGWIHACELTDAKGCINRLQRSKWVEKEI